MHIIAGNFKTVLLMLSEACFERSSYESNSPCAAFEFPVNSNLQSFHKRNLNWWFIHCPFEMKSASHVNGVVVNWVVTCYKLHTHWPYSMRERRFLTRASPWQLAIQKNKLPQLGEQVLPTIKWKVAVRELSILHQGPISIESKTRLRAAWLPERAPKNNRRSCEQTTADRCLMLLSTNKW